MTWSVWLSARVLRVLLSEAVGPAALKFDKWVGGMYPRPERGGFFGRRDHRYQVIWHVVFGFISLCSMQWVDFWMPKFDGSLRRIKDELWCLLFVRYWAHCVLKNVIQFVDLAGGWRPTVPPWTSHKIVNLLHYLPLVSIHLLMDSPVFFNTFGLGMG